MVSIKLFLIDEIINMFTIIITGVGATEGHADGPGTVSWWHGEVTPQLFWQWTRGTRRSRESYRGWRKVRHLLLSYWYFDYTVNDVIILTFIPVQSIKKLLYVQLFTSFFSSFLIISLLSAVRLRNRSTGLFSSMSSLEKAHAKVSLQTKQRSRPTTVK